MKDLGELLAYDALAEAERATGESYKTDKATEALGVLMFLSHNNARRKALEAADDSRWGITLAEYQRIVTEEGFVLVLDVPFRGNDGPEHLFVYFRADEGLLLVFDTYAGATVNGGKVYYNWRPAETDQPTGWWRYTSSGFVDDGVWVGDHDCREAIRFNLRRLREHGAFVTPWTRQPFLWLLHYGDTKAKDYDHRAITAQRIAMLPADVQAAIAGRGL